MVVQSHPHAKWIAHCLMHSYVGTPSDENSGIDLTHNSSLARHIERKQAQIAFSPRHIFHV